ncbi:hypothetical protein TrVFT333_011266 [Trichoderma virens FT-333]|nr:hypothetical protein TrVFT333_011266 [Trichoderma virens FT-333]
MDPIAIIGAASSLVLSLAKASKSLSDIRKGFQEAPMIIATMITECKTISAALTHLQNLTLGNPVALSPSLTTPETIQEGFDNALTGCMLILSALEVHLERLVKGKKPEDMGFMKKVQLLWNEETMNQLLSNLRGQHAAINTLVSLFQTESLANVHDLLHQHITELRLHRKRSIQLYQHSGFESVAGQEKELSIFNFSIQSFSFTDATSNINVQLQQSTAYRNAGAVTTEELWRLNEELRDENGGLLDKVHNLEQESEQKGHKIASLLSNNAFLQTRIDSLDQQLQAATAKIDHFSAYHKMFKQTGAECVQQIQHDRDQIKELEARLRNLRKSHGSMILSRLISFHEQWNELGYITPASSSRSSFVEPSASSHSKQADELPNPDMGSILEKTLIDIDDLITMSE